ncbi:transcription factor bHLH149-like [Phoenix dactylifera]|uniref:Transcription factor bHLH149-like n=1 Tax=Phoenix dactylifera TaxID=42345 RepID=A0A8B7BKN7_PHODC|nr:transcription factor bHLH149-like [Phoenix dactylifera]
MEAAKLISVSLIITSSSLPPLPPAMISSSSPSSSSASGSRKKPRPGPTPQPQTKWRTGAQERIYGRRLLDALRSARVSAAAGGARAVKEAADSALALTARGQSRWSRAILFGRCRRRKLLLKAGGKVRSRRQPRPVRKAASPAPPPPALKGKKVRDRFRVLARLVPGCRKLSAPSLLEETADYVAALEMQVKAMRVLADALSAAALSSPRPPPATPEPEN